MRRAELVTAAVMGLFSVWIMYLSQIPPLQIGWVPDKGPGSGAFPFWLAAAMLICSGFIFLRGWQRKTPQSQSDQPFMERSTLWLIGFSTVAIFLLLLLTHYVGAYVAIFLFLLAYLRVLGGHRWITALVIAVVTPVVLFFFFEAGMKILLPKGVTEPLFFPLYRLFVY